MTLGVRRVLVAEVLCTVGLLALALLTSSGERPAAWIECGVLSMAAAVSAVYYNRVPGEIFCSPMTVFVAAAAVVLPPELAALFLVLPTSVDYAVRRAPWWVQLGNVTNYQSATMSAAFLVQLVHESLGGSAAYALGAAIGAVVLVVVNLGWVALFQSSRRGVSLREAWLGREATEGELLSAALGVACAAVLRSAPWFTPFAFASVIALPRAFSLPLIRRDAANRERELELERFANERLRELDRLKKEFAAIISHELATPISSIAGYTEIVLRGDDPLTDEQRYFIGIVERSGQRLGRLIEDLALMDEVENELAVTFEPVDMRAVAGDSVAAAQPRAGEKELELSFVAAGDCIVCGDANRLGQVVDNLISNAIKYTPDSGAVEVRLEPTPAGVELSVADNGPGISEEDQRHLFDRFFRTASAKKSPTSGSGLGLAIVKTIVDKHHGFVHVDSAAGIGTTFTVSLPVRAHPILGRPSGAPSSRASST